VDFQGAENQSLTDNTVNYIYLTAGGVLTVNTTGFPTPHTTPHIPLATIATGTAGAAGVAGQYDHADVTDFRGRALLSVAAGLTGAEVAEAAAFFSSTDLTGAEAETLSAGASSNADALHTHNGKADASHTHDDKLNKALTSANIFVGNASNVAAGVAMSGDATISNTGAVTLANGVVTDAKVNASAAIAGSKLQALSVGANAGVIPSTGVANGHLASDAAIARSKLAEDALAVHGLPLMACRRTDGTVLTTSGGAGYVSIYGAAWGAGDMYLRTVTAQGTTETAYLATEFPLPPSYVAGGDVQVVVRCRSSGSGTPGTLTVDVQAYKMVGDGTAGSDLCTTAAQTYSATAADYAFTITPTGLAAGDHIRILIQVVVQETGGSAWLQAMITRLSVKLDIKG
jgi:hypothetical protein